MKHYDYNWVKLFVSYSNFDLRKNCLKLEHLLNESKPSL